MIAKGRSFPLNHSLNHLANPLDVGRREHRNKGPDLEVLTWMIGLVVVVGLAAYASVYWNSHVQLTPIGLPGPKVQLPKPAGIERGQPVEVESSQGDTTYLVNPATLTCTCIDWKRRAGFPRDLARCCKHLQAKLVQQGLLEPANEWERALLEQVRGPTAAWRIELESAPAVVLATSASSEWVDVLARTKRRGERIIEASGEIQSFGWNVREQRWSYGEGPPGSRELTSRLREMRWVTARSFSWKAAGIPADRLRELLRTLRASLEGLELAAIRPARRSPYAGLSFETIERMVENGELGNADIRDLDLTGREKLRLVKIQDAPFSKGAVLRAARTSKVYTIKVTPQMPGCFERDDHHAIEVEVLAGSKQEAFDTIARSIGDDRGADASANMNEAEVGKWYDGNKYFLRIVKSERNMGK